MGTASLIKEEEQMNKKNSEKEEWNPDLAWDGTGFVHVSKEFLKEEREKLRQMSYGDAADYLMFDSMWSLALKDRGWEKKHNDGHTTYVRKQHNSKYYRKYGRYVNDYEEEKLEISSNGRKAKYSRTISATVQYDDGSIELTEPSTETAYGEEAINEATEGLWDAILGSR